MTQSIEYNKSIDGLRALSCLIVTIFHSSKDPILNGGYLGVDVFFVLSGFLISNILLNELRLKGNISILQFLHFRAIRLFPALFLFLGSYILLAQSIWPETDHLKNAALVILYISDYSVAYTGSPHQLSHTWSLSVEERFYLIWPIVIPLIFTSKHPINFLFYAYIASTIGRYTLIDQPWQHAYFPMHSHMSGLLLGSLLAFLNAESFKSLNNKHVWFFALTLVAAVYLSDAHRPIFAITIAEICSAAIICHLISPNQSRIKHWLSNELLSWIGKISYSLYLWHFPFAYYFRENNGGLESTLLTVGFATLCATISYVTVEKWGRSRKKKLQQRMFTSHRED